MIGHAKVCRLVGNGRFDNKIHTTAISADLKGQYTVRFHHALTHASPVILATITPPAQDILKKNAEGKM
jgi:hypothetical protein